RGVRRRLPARRLYRRIRPEREIDRLSLPRLGVQPRNRWTRSRPRPARPLDDPDRRKLGRRVVRRRLGRGNRLRTGAVIVGLHAGCGTAWFASVTGGFAPCLTDRAAECRSGSRPAASTTATVQLTSPVGSRAEKFVSNL